MTEEIKLSVVVSLFTWIQRSRPSAKRSKFRKFLDTFCTPSDYFSAMRLILPSLDRERGTYGLKESVLAICLIDALGMSRDSADALRLINWRKGGANTGANAGNFALVAAEVLQRRQGTVSGGLTIKELNELLNRLASAESRAEKTAILATLINKTNAQEMKWVIMIILKDLKLGISEKSIFQEFHPDAEDLFNVTCDLKLVCEKLRDRTQRHKRQDIEVGKAVRPQLALRVRDPAAAWKKLHGKEVVVECKFDGDRIQIHKNGTDIHYYSRNFLDHSEYQHGMSNIITQNILVDRCILDGEMLVWDSTLNQFAEFGSNQEIAKAAKDGLDSDRQVLCYVAFDILYVGDTSVIHQSLKERHELLQKVVKPLKGRLEILVPNGGLNAHRPPGEPCWSCIAHSVNDVERFFKETIENRDEGIVIKDLNSKWEPGDRNGKWLKLKPDYIRAGSDLDVLIIGGYYGSGRRGGEVAQFLVGLADRPDPNAYPRRFISFCRVGTGLTDDDLETVAKKLKPYFRKYEYPKKMQPSFYQVTNHSKERPDVWIESPEKSIILSITSDIRTIRSEVFAAPYSLRFPRIDRVRYDKPWHECLGVQSFVELVHSSNGTTQKGTEQENQPDSKTKHKAHARKADKKNVSIVPSHFIRTDTSSVKGETLIFSNLMFYFVNVPPTYSLDSFHKMVVEHGGRFSMNLNNSVTHCVAAESKGIKYQAAKLHGDIIHYSWALDCCSQKKLIPLQPKYFLFLSESSKMKLQQEVDQYFDPYYWDLDLVDVKRLLNNIQRSENSKTIDYYRAKYCPNDKWSLFHGCSVYFYSSAESLKADWQVLLNLALRRLKHEILMGGGKISENLSNATHLVVLSVPGLDVDFDSFIKSCSFEEKNLVWKKGLHVVRSQWLENCLEQGQKLREDQYSLKPNDFEETNFVESKLDQNLEKSKPDFNGVQNKGTCTSPESKTKQRGGKDHPEKSISSVTPSHGNRKRRPASKNTKKGKTVVTRAQRVPRRRGKMSVKINEDGSEESGSDDKTNEEIKKGEGYNTECYRMAGRENFEFHQNQAAEENASINWPKKAHDTVMCETNNDQPGNKAEKFDHMELDEGNYGHEISNSEKLEVMVDPVRAMLLDMIPSLGIKHVKTTNSVVQNEKPHMDNDADIRVVEDEKLDADFIPQPQKKKKVSYKDVAGELLKD
ncbi:DNA ligase 4 [Gossypium raimondii]|nr:DNA ligase 4 [Gossypium raimondii]